MKLKEMFGLYGKSFNNADLMGILKDSNIFRFPKLSLDADKVIDEIDRQLEKSTNLSNYVMYELSELYGSVPYDRWLAENNLEKLSRYYRRRARNTVLCSEEHWAKSKYVKIWDFGEVSELPLSKDELEALNYYEIPIEVTTVQELRDIIELRAYADERKTGETALLERINNLIGFRDFSHEYPFSVVKKIFGSMEYNEASALISMESLVNYIVDKIVGTLTEREQEIISLREKENLSLQDIAERWSVTRSRIREVEAKAYRKLRHPSRSKYLKTIMQFSTYNEDTQKALALYMVEEDNDNAKILDIMAGNDKAVGINMIVNYSFIRDMILSGAFLNTFIQQSKTWYSKQSHFNDVNVMKITLEDLDVSIRTFNCLKRAGINTVGDIIKEIRKNLEKYPDAKDYSLNEKYTAGLITVRNLGKKCCDEVVDKLMEFKIEI